MCNSVALMPFLFIHIHTNFKKQKLNCWIYLKLSLKFYSSEVQVIFFHSMRQNKRVLPTPVIMSGKTDIMLLFFFLRGKCILQPPCGHTTISQLGHLMTSLAFKIPGKLV